MDVEEITARLSLRFGPPAADWAARLPDRVAGLVRRWGLEPGAPLPQGASSVVLAATRDGVPVVLKLSPDEPFLAEQAAVLRLFGPSGRVPAVLAEEAGAYLMAAVLPGTEAADLAEPPTAADWADLVTPLHALPPGPGVGALPPVPGVDAPLPAPGVGASSPASDVHALLPASDVHALLPASDVHALLPASGLLAPLPASGLLAPPPVPGLHAPLPAPGPRDLRDRCEEFFARIGRRVTGAGPVTPALWERAVTRCHALLDTQARVLLHGDLHPGNVLVGPRGLVAIDPRACVGDPCFDVVDFALAAAGREGVATRSAALAAACGLDPDRLHAWCRVLAPVVAMSRLDDEPVLTELLALAR